MKSKSIQIQMENLGSRDHKLLTSTSEKFLGLVMNCISHANCGMDIGRRDSLILKQGSSMVIWDSSLTRLKNIISMEFMARIEVDGLVLFSTKKQSSDMGISEEKVCLGSQSCSSLVFR